jgi:tetratricopeptide (TPR) repeat protein
MDRSRVEFLRETLRGDPDNTFVRYGLAMELSQSGDPAEAWAHFQYLLAHHPEYAATYYQAGMFLINQGRREEAQNVLTQGIQVTREQGKPHAQSELQAALEKLLGTQSPP